MTLHTTCRVAGFVALVLVAVACGGSESDAASNDPATTATTVASTSDDAPTTTSAAAAATPANDDWPAPVPIVAGEVTLPDHLVDVALALYEWRRYSAEHPEDQDAWLEWHVPQPGEFDSEHPAALLERGESRLLRGITFVGIETPELQEVDPFEGQLRRVLFSLSVDTDGPDVWLDADGNDISAAVPVRPGPHGLVMAIAEIAPGVWRATNSPVIVER